MYCYNFLLVHVISISNDGLSGDLVNIHEKSFCRLKYLFSSR